jgi:hypothetical protein
MQPTNAAAFESAADSIVDASVDAAVDPAHTGIAITTASNGHLRRPRCDPNPILTVMRPLM